MTRRKIIFTVQDKVVEIVSAFKSHHIKIQLLYVSMNIYIYNIGTVLCSNNLRLK